MKIFIRSLIIFTLLAAGACSTDDHMPPRPYTVMPKDANMLSSIIGTIGVEVLPPEGLAAELAAPLAEALSAALRDQDIPALASGVLTGGHRIMGKAQQAADDLVIVWTLQNSAGAILAEHTMRQPLGLKGGAPLDAGLNEALAERAAAAFAPHLQAASGGSMQAFKVLVPDITNVSGDGGKSLPLALRRALSAAGLNVVSADDAAAIRITGQVHLSDLDPANQLVSLIWLVSAPDGSEIGRVEQSNPVPRGRAEGNWGEMAYAAAAGAAEGILPLLQDYQAKNAD